MEAVTSGPKYNSDATSVPPTTTNEVTSTITNVLAPAPEGWEQTTSSRFMNALQTVTDKVVGSNANQIIDEQTGSIRAGASITSAHAAGQGGAAAAAVSTGEHTYVAHAVEHQPASHSTATEQYYKEALGSSAMAAAAEGGSGHVAVGSSAWTTNKQRIEQRTEQRQEHTRKVSTTIIKSTDLESPPEDKITYIDVPVYEEEVTYVPKKETREVKRVKKVPVYVPRVEIREKKPAPIQKIVYDEIEEVKIIEVPQERIVKVPVEVTRYNVITKDKPVPREVEVPELYDVESIHYQDVPVDTIVYEDEEVPVIISQQIKPIFVESSNSHLDVNVVQYEPEVIPVDIHVAKPVTSMLRSGDMIESSHKLVTINSAQYNSILKRLNTHLDSTQQSQLPYISEFNVVKFVPDADSQYIVAPTGIEIEGYNLKKPLGSAAGTGGGFTATNYENSSMVAPQIRVTNNDTMAAAAAAAHKTASQTRGIAQPKTTTSYVSGNVTNSNTNEAFEGYLGVRETTGQESSTSTSAAESGANRMIRSARVCCNVNPADLSSHATSVTSSRPLVSSQQQSKLTAGQIEGVTEYAAKIGQRMIQETATTNSSMVYSSQNQNHRHHHGEQQQRLMATYPDAARQNVGSRQSASGSASLRVDTVQSYRSQLEQNAARRSRVCC